VDPVLVNAGANIIGKALTPSPAGPSSADSVFSTNLGFDNSGWNVNFGSGSQTATTDKTNSQGGAGGVSGNLNSYLPWAIIFVGALVAYKMFKK
jgi:hypothetical protein